MDLNCALELVPETSIALNVNPGYQSPVPSIGNNHSCRLLDREWHGMRSHKTLLQPCVHA